MAEFFINLPFELVYYISTYLALEDILNLSTASKALHLHLSPLFWKRTFNRVRHADHPNAPIPLPSSLPILSRLTLQSHKPPPSAEIPWKLLCYHLMQGIRYWDANSESPCVNTFLGHQNVVLVAKCVQIGTESLLLSGDMAGMRKMMMLHTERGTARLKDVLVDSASVVSARFQQDVTDSCT
jgi:hypothetical protein